MKVKARRQSSTLKRIYAFLGVSDLGQLWVLSDATGLDMCSRRNPWFDIFDFENSFLLTTSPLPRKRTYIFVMNRGPVKATVTAILMILLVLSALTSRLR